MRPPSFTVTAITRSLTTPLHPGGALIELWPQGTQASRRSDTTTSVPRALRGPCPRGRGNHPVPVDRNTWLASLQWGHVLEDVEMAVAQVALCAVLTHRLASTRLTAAIPTITNTRKLHCKSTPHKYFDHLPEAQPPSHRSKSSSYTTKVRTEGTYGSPSTSRHSSIGLVSGPTSTKITWSSRSLMRLRSLVRSTIRSRSDKSATKTLY